jgi:hypothetical protein
MNSNSSRQKNQELLPQSRAGRGKTMRQREFKQFAKLTLVMGKPELAFGRLRKCQGGNKNVSWGEKQVQMNFTVCIWFSPFFFFFALS